jgi:hypothetical protein
MLVAISMLVPAALSAQTDASLSDTIREAIMKDPRSAGISEAELDLLVNALTTQAENQGVTVADIVERPVTTFGSDAVGVNGANICPGTPFFCTMTEALGFGVGDNTIPIILWTSGIALLLILGIMIEIHHRKMRRTFTAPPPTPKVGE